MIYFVSNDKPSSKIYRDIKYHHKIAILHFKMVDKDYFTSCIETVYDGEFLEFCNMYLYYQVLYIKLF